MLSLHTNSATLSAQNSIGRTQHSLSTSMTRLSTGYRINSAMDDAAGLQIATRLKAQTSGMAVAMRNTQNSTSMLQTAEGALDEVSNMLTRMKDLATQSADASSSAADKTAMQGEYDSLGKELSNIMKNTSFGSQALMVGGTLATAGGITFQIGASTSETMVLDLDVEFGATATAGSISNAIEAATSVYDLPAAAGTELTTAAGATIDLLSTAINTVAGARSSLGAAANRLDHVYNNLANISTNTKNATGRIMDVDFATESSNMTTKQMLMQAGTAMLKQTNSMSSMVMSLLQ
ncbi:Lateral flagellin [Massilia sp. RP-1-19]|uniref:Flagellin n=1 Tax=Massilia polaris TaxID=2728846 RepID=A0A848HTG8_9BURK|nr:flagellin [Massilia polaris]NML63339.1 Lateral flagellin [Massilia polaris]